MQPERWELQGTVAIARQIPAAPCGKLAEAEAIAWHRAAAVAGSLQQQRRSLQKDGGPSQ
jgi:hypothetical protein